MSLWQWNHRRNTRPSDEQPSSSHSERFSSSNKSHEKYISESSHSSSSNIMNYDGITHDLDSIGIEIEHNPPFREADHIYKYDFAGFMQYHAIVVTSKPDLLIVTEFQTGTSRGKIMGERNDPGHSMKLQFIPHNEWKRWKKVSYNANFVARTFYRSGTCTNVKPDFPELILSRVRFLLEYSSYDKEGVSDNIYLNDIIPPFHIFKSNSECCAVWCTTGRWHNLQASSFFHSTAAGQAKSTATLALYASNQTVTVPASGIWGMMGFTTKVSLIAAQPCVLPALVSYGLISVGAPLWIFKKYQSCWHTTTMKLNDSFWSTADSDIFVQCIIKWCTHKDGIPGNVFSQ